MSALEKEVREIAARVCDERLAAFQPAVVDAEAEASRQKLARILAKEFASIAEARFLLSCTDYQMKKLLKQANDGTSNNPIPATDLDGVAVVFNVKKLLAWSNGEKGKTRLRDVSAR
jgi:hypothetical protein